MVEVNNLEELEALIDLLQAQGVKRFKSDTLELEMGVKPSKSQSIFDQEDNY